MNTSCFKRCSFIKILPTALVLFSLMACHETLPRADKPVVNLTDNFSSITLKEHSFLYASQQEEPVKRVAQKLRNTMPGSGKPKYNDYVYLFFTLHNQSKHSDYLLEINNNYLHQYELYQLSADSIHLLAKGGIIYPYHQRSIENRRFIEKLKIPHDSAYAYLLKIDDRERETSLSLRVWHTAAFNKREARDLLFYNLYFGGLVFIALFSLLMGGILKMRVFFAYSLYAVLMAWFMFDNLGFAYEFFYPNAPAVKRVLDTLLITPLLFSFVNFGAVFFDVKRKHPLLYRYVRFYYLALALYLLVWAVSRADLLIHYYIRINYLFVLLTFVVQIAILVQALKHQRTKALFFTAAVTVLLIGAVLFALSYAGYLPYEWFPTNPLLIGSVIEFGIFSLALIYEVHQINKTNNKLLMANARHQKELLAAYVEGTEKERARLSAELHDNVGSRLALLKHKLKDKRHSANELSSDLDKLYQNVRTMSHTLSPHAFEIISLRDFLKHYFTDYQESTGIHVKPYFEGLPAARSPELTRQVFRIVQEALQNIQKHAAASMVEVQLIRHHNELILTIDDDGQGFEPSKIDNNKSHGLFNMRSRCEAMGGHFDISSRPGKGTHIVANIPFKA
ncbi:sensor histidine kinase [Carboxylicivirga taeanensis]|uniref:sensor histidine kinase n=1 Tax=Carboxylicivirga taeanensis TaxID=1416875 RepID=UPI003F6DC0D4